MSEGPGANAETSAPTQPETANSDAPPSSNWVSSAAGWTAVGLVVLYPLSMMPAYMAMLVLRRHGIDLWEPYRVFYSPILWCVDNVPLGQYLNHSIAPVLRKLVD